MLNDSHHDLLVIKTRYSEVVQTLEQATAALRQAQKFDSAFNVYGAAIGIDHESYLLSGNHKFCDDMRKILEDEVKKWEAV